MEIRQFFEFGSKLVSTTFQAHAVGLKSKDDQDPVGDALRLVTGNYGSIFFPVTFRHYSGRNLLDVLDTGRATLYLVSDHLRNVFEESGLTGWKTFPIRLLDKKDNELRGYQGLSVTGVCGPIDFSKSAVIEKRLVPDGPNCTYYKGFYVGLEEWDGSDLFLPKNYYGTIISLKAANVIRLNKLTNIHLTNLIDIEISEGTAAIIKSP